MLLLLALVGLTAAGAPSGQRSVSAVTASGSDGTVVIAVHITGSAGSAGTVTHTAPALLDGPRRLYFDLPGVRPGRLRSVNVGMGAVARVRIGMPDPGRTRVVIDLARAARWRVEAGSGSELRVVLESTAPRPPVPAAGDPARGSSSGRVFYAPQNAVDPSHRRNQILDKLMGMGPLVAEMAAGDGPSNAELARLLGQAELLATAARAMPRHDDEADPAIVAAVDAALMAARARGVALSDGMPQSRANAEAAARGALILFDRVRKLAPAHTTARAGLPSDR